MRSFSNSTSIGRVRHSWRLGAAALAYAAFGAGCVGFALFAVPVAWLLPGGPPARARRVRRMLGLCFRRFLALLRFLGVLSYELEGVERLGRPGQLVLANHPTLIDALFLLGFTPSPSCIVKEALWHNPLTRWSVIAAGYVSNTPTDRMIEGAANALRSGESLVVFPEGTRSVPGRTISLQRGAAAIAIRAAKVVTPVYIRCRPPTLAKGAPWYRIPEGGRAHFSISVGADLDPEPFRAAAPAPIAARELNRRLLGLFSTKLATVRPGD